jgi:hypothetical protein
VFVHTFVAPLALARLISLFARVSRLARARAPIATIQDAEREP